MMKYLKKVLNALKQDDTPCKNIVPDNSTKACQHCEVNKLFVAELKKRWKLEGKASDMPLPEPEQVSISQHGGFL